MFDKILGLKSRIGLAGLIICGVAVLGLVSGTFARLGYTVVRICGTVLLISLAVTVYSLVKGRKG